MTLINFLGLFYAAHIVWQLSRFQSKREKQIDEEIY